MLPSNGPSGHRLFLILIAAAAFLQVIDGCSCLGINKKNDRERLAEDLHIQGLILNVEGKLEEAIDTWLKEIELSPRRVRPYNNIGIAYRRMGDLDSAKEYHEKAIKVDPKFGHSYYSLGLVYYDRENYEQAKDQFLRAIKLHYFDADVYYSLGQAYKNLKEYDQATVAYEKTVKLYYSYPGVHYQLGGCYRLKGRYDLARLEFKREISGNTPWKSLCEIGLQEIKVELDPENADQWFALGMLCKNFPGADYREKAIKAFLRVVDLAPGYPDAHFQLGSLFRLDGDLVAAEDEYKKEMENNPDHEGAGKVLELLKKEKEYLREK
jgi:tetratricopeptide (TPR) repeat protein